MAHTIIEFQRDALYASMTGAEGCIRCDQNLLRWLSETTSQHRTVNSPYSSDSGIGSSIDVPLSKLPPRGKRAADDICKWKTVIGFYAIIVSTLGQANWSRDTAPAAEDWLDAWIRVWGSSGRSLADWPWVAILSKAAWFDTDEGLNFTIDVWRDAVRGSSVWSIHQAM